MERREKIKTFKDLKFDEEQKMKTNAEVLESGNITIRYEILPDTVIFAYYKNNICIGTKIYKTNIKVPEYNGLPF